MRPLGNRLIVERIKRQQLGLIHVPEAFLDDDNTGGPKEYLVHAVGPGRTTKKGVTIPIECEPGDRIVCHSYTTGHQPIGDGRFIITDDMILFVIPRKP